jgi:cell division transport system ATP-binding protein
MNFFGNEQNYTTGRPSVVKFDNVCLSYGHETPVFSSVSFRLTPGSFTFLTGPSGVGKSSIIKLIYLSLIPTSGSLTLFGHNVSELHVEDLPFIRRRIGIILQDFKLIEHMSVFENVALPIKVRGLNIQDYRQDIEELLEWVGLGHRMHAAPEVLSGGEKQRVAIARAVITRPDLILADEPTGSVDPEIAERLMRLFVELNKLGATVLIATHDTGLIQRFPANILRMANGSLWGIPMNNQQNTQQPTENVELDIHNLEPYGA